MLGMGGGGGGGDEILQQIFRRVSIFVWIGALGLRMMKLF